ncbi:GCN5-related N-acetyltransferase [Candidatus Competibacter denitrificans Run_A_D11]|mgnify:CR=1 FL=1|uniref:GCN5-related N-acetyltransferase n=1 Tax=Candidatus Competibacter denitrificans Run_A_D11 TaxID=1400863 RepID=W6M3K5_9GAMM|nr:GNAT family N-acetyltransferase [Candidatus Competibacter denitrificans]CDI02296.1 GCN5-related N-acetyltransferase [Candidatus Competibacter denitrificans Run_A_D11]HAS86006.1 GNAT family N-acetyltransferase [Candidatus Competibacteraceae bacterium]HRC69565.1 GNAT family N-acetyltransferase [Candidatus Competibacter denitrificans]
MSMAIVSASTPLHIEEIRCLFAEYAASLNFNLCFQNFSEELAGLPGDYAPPRGCLLLATHDSSPAGCIALRPLAKNNGELKRLYVRPAFRGLGIGQCLVKTLIDRAKEKGYEKIFLDTVGEMQKAQALYEAFGFVDTQPYYYNPIADARFMVRSL